MNSVTSTDSSTLRPWHFFVLAALVAATVGVFIVGDTTPSSLILLSAAIGSAALAGLGVYRTLSPLVSGEMPKAPMVIGGRTGEAIEREKMLVLRAIKELEFDCAMGKVSESDFTEMDGRLRRRAIGLMRQLDAGETDYRQMVLRDVEARLSKKTVSDPLMVTETFEKVDSRCSNCDVINESDARFCKSCGKALGIKAIDVSEFEEKES